MSTTWDTPMTCEQAMIDIIDALSGPMSEELEQHLLECESCAREYEMALNTKMTLLLAESPEPSRLFGYRIARGTRAAHAAAGAGAQSSASPTIPRPAWRFSPIDAVLLLVVAVALPLAVIGLGGRGWIVGPAVAPSPTATPTAPAMTTPPAVPGAHDPYPGPTATPPVVATVEIDIGDAPEAVRRTKAALDARDIAAIRGWAPSGGLPVARAGGMEPGLALSPGDLGDMLAAAWEDGASPPRVEGYFCADEAVEDGKECVKTIVVISGIGDVYRLPGPTPTPLPSPYGAPRPDSIDLRVAAWSVAYVETEGVYLTTWWTPPGDPTAADDYAMFLAMLAGEYEPFYVIR